MTDEAFLEAALSFMTSIPTADVYQDRPWRQQQRCLLAAQFGPREVESLAVNAIVPAPGEEPPGQGARRGLRRGRGWPPHASICTAAACSQPTRYCSSPALQTRWTGWWRRRRAA